MSLFSSDGQTLFVGQPSPVFASARRAASQSIASGSPVQVQLDTSIAAIGHSTAAPVVSTSAYSITATVAGYYRLSASALFTAPASPSVGAYANVTIRVAGTPTVQATAPLVGSSYALPVAYGVAYLAAGTAVTLYVTQTSGSSIATNTSIENAPTLTVELMR